MTMFVTLVILSSAAFAAITAELSRRGGRELIAHRPYENVRDGLPRSARTNTTLDL